MKDIRFSHFLIFFMTFFIVDIEKYFASTGIEWYSTLHLPAIIPPAWVYSIVWSFLYVSLAVIAIWLWDNASRSIYYLASLGMFVINVMANISWSYLFFYKKMIFAGFVDCAVILLTAFILMLLIARESKSAALLLLPYVAWMLFGTYQSYIIWQLN